MQYSVVNLQNSETQINLSSRNKLVNCMIGLASRINQCDQLIEVKFTWTGKVVADVFSQLAVESWF